MRFTCEKSMLVTGLNITGRTVAQKSALSALEGILCRAGNDLSLTGFNMETAIIYTIDADVADEGCCVLRLSCLAISSAVCRRARSP